MKEQFKREPILTTIAAVCVVFLLAFVLWLSHQHASHHRRYMRNAVMRQIKSHQPEIEKILAELKDANASNVANAVYEEIGKTPSTSLISRFYDHRHPRTRLAGM